ncbi:MAG: hypothetical protein BWZ03_00543 [bacterium ADurb.BinA186]|nr:MAG: hypothetical protein BWZ03_00543 [bacterium ADurb.BinA186]
MISDVLRKNNIFLIESIVGYAEIFVVVKDEDLKSALAHVHAAFMVEGKA